MPKQLYIIAGEASGDIIGGQLLKSMQALSPEPITLHGIGGQNMQAEGLQSVFPMQELSMMGFVEILPHIFKLKRRIKQTVADILAKQPDILVTIDSPGFTFRVVKALREAGYSKPCIHYVAPTVWAYKPQRAAKTAKLFDALLVLLPFEPPYFAVQGLPTHFVGHPVAWLHKQKGDAQALRQQHNIASDASIIGLMPGSRMGELKRHLPLFEEAAKQLSQRIGNAHFVILSNEQMHHTLQQATTNWPVPVSISTHKQNTLAACQLALAKSGTIALETAVAGIPTVTCFKANPISVWLVRRMIQIPYANLINIMALFDGKDAPIRELLQEDCTANNMAKALLELHENPEKQAQQKAAYATYLGRLGLDEDTSPSDKAAKHILAAMQA